MVEQIEVDRETIRKGESRKNGSGFSYLPYLAPKKEKKKHKMVSISNLSTLNVICYVDESIKQADKYILSNIDVFKEELLNRKDLFHAAMKFITQNTIRNSLYYWNPGIHPDNIFEFIHGLIPDFVRQYKSYYIQALVTNTEHLDCLLFIKEYCGAEYHQFEIIKTDISLFENGVSGMFWIDEPYEYSGIFAEIPGRVDIGDDVEGLLLPEVSYVECLIGGRPFVVPLSRLEGLISHRDSDRQFWEEQGVFYREWEYLMR